jgi:hypothetical protein
MAAKVVRADIALLRRPTSDVEIEVVTPRGKSVPQQCCTKGRCIEHVDADIGDPVRGDRYVAAVPNVKLQEVFVIHFVNVIREEHQDVRRRLELQESKVLDKSVCCAVVSSK